MHITLNTKWDLDDFVALRSLYHKHTCAPLFRWMANFSVIIMTGVAIFAVIIGHFTMSVITISAVIAHFTYMRSPLSPFLDKRKYKKIRDKLAPGQWDFHDDKIIVKDSISNTELKWAAFSRIVIHPNAIFLYGIEGYPIFIRNEYFNNLDDYELLLKKFVSEGCEMKNVS